MQENKRNVYTTDPRGNIHVQRSYGVIVCIIFLARPRGWQDDRPWERGWGLFSTSLQAILGARLHKIHTTIHGFLSLIQLFSDFPVAVLLAKSPYYVITEDVLRTTDWCNVALDIKLKSRHV